MNQRASRSLKSLQEWLQSVITHPNGVSMGIESARSRIDVAADQIESVVPSSSQLDAVSKIEVYGNAYFARLMECLGEEYPAVRTALGAETFDSFAFSYLQEFPSTSYTLADLGRNFPDFLKQTKPADAGELGWADFLIDLSRLEWHYSEIFNGPGTEKTPLLSPDELRSISPEKFASCRLIPAPCVRLDHFQFPVHEYATAVRKNQESPKFPPAQPSWLVMTRRNYVVRRVAVDEAEYHVLKELIETGGEPIGDVLERVAVDWEAEMQQHLQSWFSRWAAAGYFIAVEETA